jgi:site-specific DNA-methyltransferase (cytosine-N4-specific)
MRIAYKTKLGRMYQGDAAEVMRSMIERKEKVSLIFTSPPFALVTKKAYGNENQTRYVDWFMQFAPLFWDLLKSDGSLVIEIGGSWMPGLPVRSLYQYKLLMRLCEFGFHLTQEFYHYNPARLPTPVEWVNIRRIRVKDAVHNVWWLTKQPFVDSDNRRVLQPYSESMKKLIQKGVVKCKRPSGHDIGANFHKDCGGSIPSNVIQLSNTDSAGQYLRSCRAAGIPPHPARFPIGLPEFFIKFMTRPRELVMDPFAGSNVTGAAAEQLGRRWVASELVREYIAGSKFRFNGRASAQPKK